MSDGATLKAMRWTVLVITLGVLAYAMALQGTPIYDLVSGAYQVPLVGAFVPLVFGLYWRGATTQGAVLSVCAGLGTWLMFLVIPAWATAFPQQLAGLLAALIGMFAGSWLPQWIEDHKGHVHHFQGSTAETSAP
jgi:Na+/proline symporter